MYVYVSRPCAEQVQVPLLHGDAAGFRSQGISGGRFLRKTEADEIRARTLLRVGMTPPPPDGTAFRKASASDFLSGRAARWVTSCVQSMSAPRSLNPRAAVSCIATTGDMGSAPRDADAGLSGGEWNIVRPGTTDADDAAATRPPPRPILIVNALNAGTTTAARARATTCVGWSTRRPAMGAPNGKPGEYRTRCAEVGTRPR
ncbi:hypothetical protein B0H11DRAFT_720358 [Mycena galericulata]|nr:hypothetical protein B0H11DRAFT_720358 [Mycena galericulata]